MIWHQTRWGHFHRAALFLTLVAVTGMLWAAGAFGQERGGVLRIGMTAADIPFTGGQPDQGFEGFRFIGYQLYEALVRWDLSQGEKLPDLVPALAESWEVKADDPTKWIFKLRRGVKFHDGSEFNADAVLWNWDKLKTKEAPQFDSRQAGWSHWATTEMQSWRKLDDYTVELTTTRPSSFVLTQLTYVLYGSPHHWENVGRDWRAFATNPAGTGPFRLTKLVQRERAELEPHRGYWDNKRLPKVDKVILLPLPEVTTRLAALRNAQVDWIEVPPPDAIPQLRQAGFQIFLRPYPHNWPYNLNLTKPPFDNKLVRQAVNYAIDREGLCKSLLNGTCIPSTGVVYPGHPWFGNPTRYEYNPAKAKELLKQAGYDGKDKRVKTSVLISTSGSGQMLPLPMNEFIQESLREVGIDLELVPIEWNALIQRWFQGFQHADNADLGAINISLHFVEPHGAFVRRFHSAYVAPKSTNVMPYINPEVDRLITAAETTFDMQERDRYLAKLHEIIVDDAPWVFIVHDLNPRAMSPKVKGFVQPQSWFVDLTLPWVEK
ncbi:MAG TPA: ABC transporter substrate-binding protein [Alphaproteobacteria bacterium]|nr:ABC transporter substrate-binding protein [Alphaproteobacteria bacterium]